MTRVLVTGVRGKTGLPLVELLVARRRVEVLGGSSSPSTVTIDGVRPTAFSWDEPSGWAVAIDDIDALYVVRPDRADAPDLVGALLAETSPRTRVVLLSERDADYTGPDGWAPRAERAVRDSGRAWTILRPNWFMQVFTDPRFYRDQVSSGELPFSSGGASVAWIDARDIAAVGEALLDRARRSAVRALRSGSPLVAAHRPAALSCRRTSRDLPGDHDRREAPRPRAASFDGRSSR